LFALEYSQSSLTEGGEGQYDPTFIVTKLGARVSRMMVAGVIDRMERHDGDAGPRYRGQLRDPTGVHMFDIAPFQPELHGEAEELLSRFERGDRFLMLMMGRARHWTNDEGSVFTSVQAEGMKIIERNEYAGWLASASDATLRRIDAYERAMDADVDETSLRAAGVPIDLVNGIISSRGHYGQFDPETYRVGILNALALATGKSDISVDIPAESSLDMASHGEPPVGTGETLAATTEAPSKAVNSNPSEGSSAGQDPANVIIEKIKSSDEGEGVHYDVLMRTCMAREISVQDFEAALDDLRDTQCEIIEPNFGWFRLLPSS
jgi:RPA family protein